jgi:magnesium chelatase family protein
VLPFDNGEEAALVRGAAVFAAGNLLEALEFLKNPMFTSPRKKSSGAGLNPGSVDFADVKGQGEAKRALEVAAAGGHNFLLIGSPGCGKTLLARRFPSILPGLSEEESLETTRIYSVAGLLKPGLGLVKQRPFRSPHHSISDQALVGGGSSPRPGEVSLAHNGVLFLDELPEFHRNALESLRLPLEEGAVTISRTAYSVTYPCRILLGAAMNPCPCGRLMELGKRCQCRMEEVARYRARISGPLLDRIDIQLELPGLSFSEMEGRAASENSAAISRRVEAARELQRTRFHTGGKLSGVFCNAHLAAQALREFCPLGTGPARLLRDAVESLGLSARAHDRIIKVARTIADLEGSDSIREEHLVEAVHFRSLDRRLEPFA